MKFTSLEYINRSAKNPKMFPPLQPSAAIKGVETVSGKRVRQSEKPLMNRLETEFFNVLVYTKNFQAKQIRIQAITFKLANGLKYTPDFVFLGVPTFAWEVKGKWVDGDSFPKLKMAAFVWPEIRWFLVWKENGEWKEQTVLP